MEEACKSLKLVRFFIFSPLSFSSRRFFFVGRFLSHRFHRYTQIFFIMIFFIGFHGGIGGILAYRITHGFSRNFGRWPMARALYMLLFFCHADFADDADFSSWGLFCPTDFTDLHRFSMESLVNLFVQPQGVSATTGQVASAKIRE